MPIVSVIIPVYNVEEYLGKCLRSILNQTLYNIEIICVNDGSTDGSLGILQKYAQLDRRIVILNQENQGQGVARNNAMKIAKGEYVSFVDSDDWIEPDMLEVMCNAAKANDANVVQAPYYSHVGGRIFVIDHIENSFPNQKSHTFVKVPKCDVFKASWGPCQRIYKLSFLKENNIEFSSLKFGEDIPFSLVIKLTTPILYVSKPFYNYRIRQDSSRSYNVEYDKIFASIYEVLEKYNLSKEFKSEVDEYVAYMCFIKYKRLPPQNRLKFLLLHIPSLNFSQFIQLAKSLYIAPSEHLMCVRRKELRRRR